MSYSTDKKDALSLVQIKKRCCRSALLYGLLYPHSDFDKGVLSFTTESKIVRDLFVTLIKQCFNKNVIMSGKYTDKDESTYAFLSIETKNETDDTDILEICNTYKNDGIIKEELFTCESCKTNFMKGVFISSGSIADPEKSIHLELTFSDEKAYDGMKNYLESIFMIPKEIERRGNKSLYYKKHEEIEDFLAFIGDSQGAMQIMNLSIFKSLRNNANRYSNCDAANLSKATNAASVHLRAIEKLMQYDMLKELPNDLQITAQLRIDHPELTLAELAAIHSPPITKSGVNHRLKKLVLASSSFAE